MSRLSIASLLLTLLVARATAQVFSLHLALDTIGCYVIEITAWRVLVFIKLWRAFAQTLSAGVEVLGVSFGGTSECLLNLAVFAIPKHLLVARELLNVRLQRTMGSSGRSVRPSSA